MANAAEVSLGEGDLGLGQGRESWARGRCMDLGLEQGQEPPAGWRSWARAHGPWIMGTEQRGTAARGLGMEQGPTQRMSVGRAASGGMQHVTVLRGRSALHVPSWGKRSAAIRCASPLPQWPNAELAWCGAHVLLEQGQGRGGAVVHGPASCGCSGGGGGEAGGW